MPCFCRPIHIYSSFKWWVACLLKAPSQQESIGMKPNTTSLKTKKNVDPVVQCSSLYACSNSVQRIVRLFVPIIKYNYIGGFLIQSLHLHEASCTNVVATSEPWALLF